MEKCGLLLVTACDAGGANILAPSLQALQNPFKLFTQEPASKIIERWGIPQTKVPKSDWEGLKILSEKIISRYKPSAILTGTSWGLTLDKALVYVGKNLGLKTASIIDHWDLYRERFSLIENGRNVARDIFKPDSIWVIDEFALSEAVAAGLPKMALRIVGQAHLEYLSNKLISLKSGELKNKAVFISERINDDFPIGSDIYKGYDEYSTLRIILSALKNQDLGLCIKLHPQEERDKYSKLLKDYSAMQVEVIQDEESIEELVISSKIIIGMNSMALLEASLVRSDVISLTPNSSAKNFIGNRMSVTKPVADLVELEHFFKNSLTFNLAGIKKTKFGELFSRSTEKTILEIERLMWK